MSLEERIRFHQELKPGDEVDVSCTDRWGGGKTFRVQQDLRRPDGTLIAEITNVGGLLELTTRRLLPNPGMRWRSVADGPGTARTLGRGTKVNGFVLPGCERRSGL